MRAAFFLLAALWLLPDAAFAAERARGVFPPLRPLTADCVLDAAHISGMPVASSHYWNSVHGRAPGVAAQDLEGIATVRNLAKNMTFLMKSIALGKAQFGLPELDPVTPTHFIR